MVSLLGPSIVVHRRKRNKRWDIIAGVVGIVEEGSKTVESSSTTLILDL